jgi:hypothetical protein
VVGTVKLIDLVLDVHARLDEAGIDHALGGALAFGYYGDPRGTLDGDILVFLPGTEADRVTELLAPTGFVARPAPDDRLPISGVRLQRQGERIHIDLFFAVDQRYEEIAARRRTVPFGPDGTEMPILSADDLVVFKLSFGRPKDWVDLEALVVSTPDLHLDQIEDLVVDLRGPTLYPRVARLRDLHRRITGGD